MVWGELNSWGIGGLGILITKGENCIGGLLVLVKHQGPLLLRLSPLLGTRVPLP